MAMRLTNSRYSAFYVSVVRQALMWNEKIAPATWVSSVTAMFSHFQMVWCILCETLYQVNCMTAINAKPQWESPSARVLAEMVALRIDWARYKSHCDIYMGKASSMSSVKCAANEYHQWHWCWGSILGQVWNDNSLFTSDRWKSSCCIYTTIPKTLFSLTSLAILWAKRSPTIFQ